MSLKLCVANARVTLEDVVDDTSKKRPIASISAKNKCWVYSLTSTYAEQMYRSEVTHKYSTETGQFSK